MARKRIIAGNWKMNMTPSEAVKLVEELKPLVVNDDVDVVYCVPAIDIVPVVEAVKGTNVQVGAENFYIEDKGAYTGEISAPMLVDAGVKYVIIGHSERREYFKEDDAFLNKKVKKAIASGLTPILCCGETLEQREMGVTMDWIRLQIKSDLAGVAADDTDDVAGVAEDEAASSSLWPMEDRSSSIIHACRAGTSAPSKAFTPFTAASGVEEVSTEVEGASSGVWERAVAGLGLAGRGGISIPSSLSSLL